MVEGRRPKTTNYYSYKYLSYIQLGDNDITQKLNVVSISACYTRAHTITNLLYSNCRIAGKFGEELFLAVWQI